MSKRSEGSITIDRYIGDRIRTGRLARGMSQTKLAEALGLTFQQVQKYEKGTNRVGAGRLVEIAQILGVTSAWLYEGADAAADGTDPLSPLLAERGAVELLQHYAAIDPALRRALLGLARDLAGGGKIHHREAA